MDKAAADGSQQWGGPVDEEGHGKAGVPERSGVPRDPAHARSKRLSYYAVIVAGFALAVDFTMSLMSIQARRLPQGGCGWCAGRGSSRAPPAGHCWAQHPLPGA